MYLLSVFPQLKCQAGDYQNPYQERLLTDLGIVIKIYDYWINPIDNNKELILLPLSEEILSVGGPG